ncbi:hypothetical protein EV424DRAFT_1539177 [Suillus variegatus]|nr:hypothetical protein EV424DRAFT_1539177 [Suillus variegatus]
MSHNLTPPSSLPLTTFFPSGDNAMVFTLVSPSRQSSSICFPLFKFHTRSEPSHEQVIIRCPPGRCGAIDPLDILAQLRLSFHPTTWRKSKIFTYNAEKSQPPALITQNVRRSIYHEESDSEEEEGFAKADITKLTPLLPEAISEQATINLVVKVMSGVMTVRFKIELVCDVTNKLGYANAKIYKCQDEACLRPCFYPSYRSDNSLCERPGCGHRMKLIRHCRSHGCCSSSDRRKRNMYLATVEIMKLENLIILQNNVDLLKEAQALAHQKSIAALVKDTISVQLKYNTDAVNEYIVKRIPIATSRFSAASFLCMPRTITCSLQFQEG